MPLPHLRRVRWIARALLLAGVSAIAAANVMDAESHPVAWLLAVLPPFALVGCVELTCLAPVRDRAPALARGAATVAVGGFAGWISYRHLVAVVGDFESPSVVAGTVVGMVVVASLSLVEMSRRVREAEAEAVKPGRAGVLALVGRTGARGAAAIVAPPTYVNGLTRRPPPSVSA